MAPLMVGTCKQISQCTLASWHKGMATLQLTAAVLALACSTRTRSCTWCPRRRAATVCLAAAWRMACRRAPATGRCTPQGAPSKVCRSWHVQPVAGYVNMSFRQGNEAQNVRKASTTDLLLYFTVNMCCINALGSRAPRFWTAGKPAEQRLRALPLHTSDFHNLTDLARAHLGNQRLALQRPLGEWPRRSPHRPPTPLSASAHLQVAAN